MFLYRVARYGNEEEGPDGNDTNFIVYAKYFKEAVSLVDNYLKLLPCGNRVDPFCNVVIEISIIDYEDKESRIIMGPCYEPCIHYLRRRSWYRGSIEEEWEEEVDDINE